MFNSTIFFRFFTRLRFCFVCLIAILGSLFLLTATVQGSIELDKHDLDNATLITDSLKAATEGDSTIVVGSTKYKRSKFGCLFFGKHYRKEWATPIKVPCLDITTAKGGLTPIKKGGGMQTKSLRFISKDSVEYTFRSIDKDIGGALKPVFQGTFVENFLQDGISSAHPYGFLVVPYLAEAVGIFHTTPTIYYLPATDYLGEYRESFGDMLGMLEVRPDDDLSAFSRFGYSKNVVSTDKLFEKLHENQEDKVDAWMYARARLLDMLIGDWDRHQDQWRWAEFEKDSYAIYRPVPRDRDQAFVQFEGLLPWLTTRKWAMRKMKHFGGKVNDVKGMTMQAKDLDQSFLNEFSMDDWKLISDSVKQELTDSIIELAVRQLPEQIFNISGKEIIEKLKSRRNGLVDYAVKFYQILAKKAVLVGSNEQEWFEVERLDDKQTSLKMYAVDENGKKGRILYERIFYSVETDEIHLYGLGGNDCFEVSGEVSKGINLFLSGGSGLDSFENNSIVRKGGNKLVVYIDEQEVGYVKEDKMMEVELLEKK
ncbi:MAG: hypothetical protein R3E32_02425 [Chitinophagales bacterium]